ncbi:MULTISPECIES: superoxide dismutase family protein [Asticcacaulis]|uniref:superoxide dismutase family protein n=1 Tax=Asticcacaulis TaxID=76890 RepID=UPI001AE2761A|nr:MULTISPECIES: superoxide dismutase family protein [Asticcacaulis]MBP2161772.1 Cu-Zn family superoxide dismutase [Asticcacaulis solisilvae]MDR6802818.1 Cu-Zn family superoxide dismutase [Asticcacaulis sp. BE141]
MRLIAAAALIAAIATPVMAQTPATYTGALKGPTGADLGKVVVTDAPKGVLLRVEAKGLTPGWHAIHFHEKGACTDEKFASAGSHVHGEGTVIHGLLRADATDFGDLPNIFVQADGTATAEIYSTLVTVKGSGAKLLDDDGASVVIHGNPDDYTSQPVGNAGPRLACAVIK